MNDIEQLLKTTLTELRGFVNPGTVVGNPIKVEDTTIIPLVKASFGFGTGGGGGKISSGDGTGGGAGGGANLEPVALLIIDANGARIEPLKKSADSGGGGSASTMDKVVGTITDAIKKRIDKDKDDSSQDKSAENE